MGTAAWRGEAGKAGEREKVSGGHSAGPGLRAAPSSSLKKVRPLPPARPFRLSRRRTGYHPPSDERACGRLLVAACAGQRPGDAAAATSPGGRWGTRVTPHDSGLAPLRREQCSERPYRAGGGAGQLAPWGAQARPRPPTAHATAAARRRGTPPRGTGRRPGAARADAEQVRGGGVVVAATSLDAPLAPGAPYPLPPPPPSPVRAAWLAPWRATPSSFFSTRTARTRWTRRCSPPRSGRRPHWPLLREGRRCRPRRACAACRARRAGEGAARRASMPTQACFARTPPTPRSPSSPSARSAAWTGAWTAAPRQARPTGRGGSVERGSLSAARPADSRAPLVTRGRWRGGGGSSRRTGRRGRTLWTAWMPYCLATTWAR